MLTDYATEHNLTLTSEAANKLIELLIERVTFEHELIEQSGFYFYPPSSYDENMAANKWTSEASEVLAGFAGKIELMEAFSESDAKEVLVNLLEEKGVKMGKVMPALRLLLTGGASGPDLMGIVQVLGGKATAGRIRDGISALNAETE